MIRATEPSLVDTDALPAHDWRIDDLVQNTSEVPRVCAAIYANSHPALSGVRKSQIGIISHYRQQVKLVQYLLQGRVKNGFEIHTTDQSQGRDKELSSSASFVRMELVMSVFF